MATPNVSFWTFLYKPFSLGLFTWLLTWGLNRVYLFFKKLVS